MQRVRQGLLVIRLELVIGLEVVRFAVVLLVRFRSDGVNEWLLNAEDGGLEEVGENTPAAGLWYGVNMC